MRCVQVQLRMQRFLVIFVALPCRNILCVVLYLPFQDAQVTWKQTYSRVRDDWRWSVFDAFYIWLFDALIQNLPFQGPPMLEGCASTHQPYQRAAFGSLDEACDPNLAIKLDCLKIISLEQKWTTFLVRTSVTSVKWPTKSNSKNILPSNLS